MSEEQKYDPAVMAAARKAYEDYPHSIEWNKLSTSTRASWYRIAVSVLEGYSEAVDDPLAA